MEDEKSCTMICERRFSRRSDFKPSSFTGG